MVSDLIFFYTFREQIFLILLPCLNLIHLVPVSVEDEQTGIIGRLTGLQSLNSLSQFILNHLQ